MPIKPSYQSAAKFAVVTVDSPIQPARRSYYSVVILHRVDMIN